MALDRLAAGEQRGHCRRVLHRNRHVVELEGVALPPLLLRGHLQNHGLNGDLHRGRRDLVIRESHVILELLDALVVGIELQGHCREIGHRFDVQSALGLVPHLEKRADAAGCEVDVLGKKRLVHRRTAAEPVHADLDVAEALIFCTGLDHLLADHHMHGQVKKAELLCESNLVALGRRRSGDAHRKSGCQGGNHELAHTAAAQPR